MRLWRGRCATILGMDDTPILVIDDDADVLETIVEILQQAGYTALDTADARQADVLLRYRRFALIITDVVMPHLTGLQVLELAKRHSPDAQVLLISAYTSRNMVAEAMAKGACGMIEKPFDNQHLLSAVREALRRARWNPESGASQ